MAHAEGGMEDALYPFKTYLRAETRWFWGFCERMIEAALPVLAGRFGMSSRDFRLMCEWGMVPPTICFQEHHDYVQGVCVLSVIHRDDIIIERRVVRGYISTDNAPNL